MRRWRRCWVHKLANVLDKLPKRLQPRAEEALHEIMYAATRAEARAAIQRFREEYGAKYPKAVASLEEAAEELLTFFEFPAEHWPHLCHAGTQAKENPWARFEKGCPGDGVQVNRVCGEALAQSEHTDLVELVRLGVRFEDGVQKASTAERDAA